MWYGHVRRVGPDDRDVRRGRRARVRQGHREVEGPLVERAVRHRDRVVLAADVARAHVRAVPGAESRGSVARLALERIADVGRRAGPLRVARGARAAVAASRARLADDAAVAVRAGLGRGEGRAVLRREDAAEAGVRDAALAGHALRGALRAGVAAATAAARAGSVGPEERVGERDVERRVGGTAASAPSSLGRRVVAARFVVAPAAARAAARAARRVPVRATRRAAVLQPERASASRAPASHADGQAACGETRPPKPATHARTSAACKDSQQPKHGITHQARAM
jgi:hypothetical protein